MNDWTKPRCPICTGTGLAETESGYKPCDCPNGIWALKRTPALLAVRRLRKDAPLAKAARQKPNIPPVDPEEDRLRRQRNEADLQELLLRQKKAAGVHAS